MRVILHSDLNNFYASCECLLRPELKGLPVVVCGKIKDRHGVVLAKNMIAKNAGIKTGMTLYEARKLQPNLEAVEANHDLYLKYSRLVKKIYSDYTDRIESFGIDEAWLDVTESVKLFGSGETIAELIRKRVREEIGLTVSIGVSYNKIFAKLGSDIKKPDAVTVIDKNNYKDIVWSLPVSDLLYVGKATTKKLNALGIYKIGHLAKFDRCILRQKLGKWGEYLSEYANGNDLSIVCKMGESDDIKSVGNSVTYYRDMDKLEDVMALIYMLAESVSYRMKKSCVGRAKTLHISVVDNELTHYGMQCAFTNPTNLSNDIASTAIELYKKNYIHIKKVRGVGVSVSNFVKEEQLLLGESQKNKDKLLKLDNTIEDIRRRFGRKSVCRALTKLDARLQDVEINGANITSRAL
ncbi:MAG: DNA polymerase IV [Clostridia bacterium]|nr:DNA polymerase IV [Clostridia bacterium]